MHDLQIWRHTCFTFDFDTGETKLVENGKVRFKSQSNDIQKLGSTMNHVAAGCFYRTSGTGYQSMYGRVTDVQIFGNVLSDTELEEITGCRARREGDVLSWDTAKWVISGRKRNIRKRDWTLKALFVNFPLRVTTSFLREKTLNQKVSTYVKSFQLKLLVIEISRNLKILHNIYLEKI